MEFTENTAVPRDSGELKRQILRYLRWWPLFVACLLLGLFGAWLYLRYATPQYMTKASVYLKSAAAKSGEIMGLKDFQNMALPSGLMTNEVDNEISVVKSKPLLYNVVKSLGLEVKTISEGKVKEAELYENSPVTGQILSLKDPRGFRLQTYRLSPNGSTGFTLKNEKQNLTGTYGQPVVTAYGTFVLRRKPGITFDKPLTLQVLNPRLVADQLEASINVVVPQKKSSIMELSRVGMNPLRSEDILNELIRQYNADAIKDKNAEAMATASFIDERLDLITKELGGIEGRKENFKAANKIADLEAQAKLSLENASDNTKKLLDLGTQLEMIDSVLRIAGSSTNDQLLPTNVGMPGGLSTIIEEYNQLVLTRNRTLRQATPANPAVQQFNRDIASMRNLIRDNLRKSRASLQVAMGQIQDQLNQSGTALSKFPQQERVFRDIERQQNLKEALFLYLLQKREETSIALSVNTPKAKVVNPAYTANQPVAPKKNIVYLAAALLGLLLPGAFLYTRFALDTKVKSKRDISDALPDLPVLAEIPTVGKDETDLVAKNDLSVYAEAFRILTANLKFMLTKISGTAPVILFTSSVKGEGKTTVSVNSALSLASTKKVIIIGADLRNPQLERYIVPGARGLSDYLADATVHTDDIIHPSGLTPNLDTISSGTIPPNPTDLLEDSRLADLLTDLRQRYDYILIDSAPLMMVSDSFHILRHSDVLVYVARARYTEKELLDYAGTVAKDDNVTRMALVLNDVDKKEMRYGYGGKYGYGYHDEAKKPWWKF